VAKPEFPHSSPDILQQGVQSASGAEEDAGVTPDTKYGKEEVNYRPAGSSNTRCERCKHFAWSSGGRGTGTCRLVAGTIQPDYVSDKFQSGGGGLRDLITNEATH
jgi:hypothetical protein